MKNSVVTNPSIPLFLRVVTWVECLVVFGAGFGLFFFPALERDFWAWPIPAFNSRFVGTIYFAALLPLLVFAISGRWSPGKLVLWMIFTFTGCILIAMLFHFQAFEFGRLATWVFWPLYLFLPINSAIHLLIYRKVGRGDARPTHILMKLLLLALAVVLGLYSLGLLIAPELATAFWPWPVDTFHGHIYLATFLTPAVGALVLLRRASAAEYFTLGLSLLTFGVLSPMGVVLTGLIERPGQVNYASIGTWVFMLMNLSAVGLGIFLVGVSLYQRFVAKPKPAPAKA